MREVTDRDFDQVVERQGCRCWWSFGNQAAEVVAR